MNAYSNTGEAARFRKSVKWSIPVQVRDVLSVPCPVVYTRLKSFISIWEVLMNRLCSLCVSLAAFLACIDPVTAAEPPRPPALPSRPMELSVDATEAPRKLLHARLVIPASPGPLTLCYPRWIPGEHAPSGPITDLAGLK